MAWVPCRCERRRNCANEFHRVHLQHIKSYGVEDEAKRERVLVERLRLPENVERATELCASACEIRLPRARDAARQRVARGSGPRCSSGGDGRPHACESESPPCEMPQWRAEGPRLLRQADPCVRRRGAPRAVEGTDRSRRGRRRCARRRTLLIAWLELPTAMSDWVIVWQWRAGPRAAYCRALLGRPRAAVSVTPTATSAVETTRREEIDSLRNRAAPRAVMIGTSN